MKYGAAVSLKYGTERRICYTYAIESIKKTFLWMKRIYSTWMLLVTFANDRYQQTLKITVEVWQEQKIVLVALL